jgi:hypothetical protein
VLVKRLQLCAVTAASTAVAETYGRNFSEKWKLLDEFPSDLNANTM